MTTATKVKNSLTKAQQALLKKIMPSFKDRWGKSAHIDLFQCEHKRLTDPALLERFVKKVIKEVGMVAHGPIYIDRFGYGELEGYSAMQFIQTSSITVHLDEKENRAFIDIFSCKDFDAPKARDFCKDYFKAKKSNLTALDR